MELLFLAFYYSSDLTFPLNLVKRTFPILLLITMSIWELSLGRNGPQLAIRPLRVHRRVAVLRRLAAAAGWGGGGGICGFSSELGVGQVHRGCRVPEHIPDSVRRETRKPLSRLKSPGSGRLGGHRRRRLRLGGLAPWELPHIPAEPPSLPSLCGSFFLPGPSAQDPTLCPRPPVQTCLPLTLKPDAWGSPRPSVGLGSGVKVAKGGGKLLFSGFRAKNPMQIVPHGEAFSWWRPAHTWFSTKCYHLPNPHPVPRQRPSLGVDQHSSNPVAWLLVTSFGHREPALPDLELS